MGEGQILAQVKQVFAVGQNCPGFGRHLTGLFKQAITGGKRVRSETSIASGASVDHSWCITGRKGPCTRRWQCLWLAAAADSLHLSLCASKLEPAHVQLLACSLPCLRQAAESEL